MNLLLVDAQQRPELFYWNGSIDPSQLREWLAESGLQMPADLEAFYRATGGGDFFESETILGPFADTRMGDDLLTINSMRRAEGMSERFLLFHQGVSRTAIDQSTLRYVALDATNAPTASFKTFNEWYYSIRGDFAETYGLPKFAVVV